MIRRVSLGDGLRLKDYAALAYLSPAVQELRAAARRVVPSLKGRTVWMLNSTAQGGGVAEMLPRLVSLLRDLGVRTEWLVLNPGDPAFFALTKRIHNLIHGAGRPGFDGRERRTYREVSLRAAEELERRVAPEDILVVHDPQPLAVGAEVKRRRGLRAVWRCHIGLDRTTPATEAAWKFLQPWARLYDHAVFSAAEYIPAVLAGKSSVIHPAIDPLSHKNRELSAHKLVGILCNAGLMAAAHPVLTADWEHPAQRLAPDGRFVPARLGDGVGLLYRPIVAQISRWDALKGWLPLLEGFVRLKECYRAHRGPRTRRRRRIELLRLVLAGPEPAAIEDDPEGQKVLAELRRAYRRLKPEDQRDVVLLSLPMVSVKQNHLMVNVIQRCSTVVVQNSLEEGFGLTATEAMWKHVPVLGTTACGLRLQIRDGIDGRITADPEDPEEIAAHLDRMLGDPVQREILGRNAQRRVYEKFLIFKQVESWLGLLAETVARPPQAS